MDERRYRDDEIAEIFETAAAPRPRRPGALRAEGLSLEELQTIGQEVGLSPERIAEAAAALEHERSAPARSIFGMPISVRRVVNLARLPTDREWELLVGELRNTFDAVGRDRSQGNLRQWTNGNLHAYLEPTETGARLRLGTTKGNAIALNWMGISWLITAAFMGVSTFVSGEPAGSLAMTSMFGAMGAGSFGFNAIRLPSWARTRSAQMEHVARRAESLLGSEPEPSLPTTPATDAFNA